MMKNHIIGMKKKKLNARVRVRVEIHHNPVNLAVFRLQIRWKIELGQFWAYSGDLDRIFSEKPTFMY